MAYRVRFRNLASEGAPRFVTEPVTRDREGHALAISRQLRGQALAVTGAVTR
jgi:hypothetical protein